MFLKKSMMVLYGILGELRMLVFKEYMKLLAYLYGEMMGVGGGLRGVWGGGMT